MKVEKIKLLAYGLVLFIASFSLLIMESCAVSDSKPLKKITESEILRAQKAWAIGLIGIGVAYENSNNYKEAASNFIEEFYAYDETKVLFKPTLAKEKPFRTTLEGALSYFIGDNEFYPEDKGFALETWKDVRWENAGIINSDGGIAVAMGNYYFTNKEGITSKFEYTFCYKKVDDGSIKIVAHKSALPYGD